MKSFATYKELQDLLLLINENSEIDHISKFIIINGILDDKNESIPAMELIASFAFSRPKLLKKIVSILIAIPKFKFDLNIILTDGIFDIFTYHEITQRIKILYLLLLRSNHIKESIYDSIVTKYNEIYFKITLSPFQNKNFKFFFNFENDQLIYKAIANDDVNLLQQFISLNDVDIDKYFHFPNFEIYTKFESSTLLQYSTFLGSINCFKFLLLNTNNNDFEILLEFSIAGGNIDIIHITENELHYENIENKQQLLYTAILFMQNDLIEYIIDIYGAEIDDACYIKCILSSNYQALIQLMDLDNRESLKKYYYPIDVALYQEHLPFFYFLATLNEEFTNFNKIFYFIPDKEMIAFIEDALKNKIFYIHYIYDTPFCYTYLNLLYNLNKKKEIDMKFNWINDEISNIGDERYYMERKRFYDSKYRKKKLNTNPKKQQQNKKTKYKKRKNCISKKLIRFKILTSLSECD